MKTKELSLLQRGTLSHVKGPCCLMLYNSKKPDMHMYETIFGFDVNISLFPFQVLHACWPTNRLPPLESIISLSRKINAWLKKDSSRVIVIHCQVSLFILLKIYFNWPF